MHISIIAYEIRIISNSAELANNLPFVAEQMVREYAGYPYFYKDSFEAEMAHLMKLSASRDAALAIAYADRQPIGFIFGSPLKNMERLRVDDCVVLVEQDNCYFSFVPLPTHRSDSMLAQQLFEAIEYHVAKLGFVSNCFLCEACTEDDQRRPEGYPNLNLLCRTLAYKQVGAAVSFTWDTLQPIGGIKQQEHKMHYWVKSLAEQ